MKTIIIAVCCALTAFVNASAQDIHSPQLTPSGNKTGHADLRRFPIKGTLHFKLHKPRRSCKSGFGLCDGSISVTIGYSKTVGTLYGETFTIEFTEDIRPYFTDGEDVSALTIDGDESLTLIGDAAAIFGQSAITFLPGTYPVDYGATTYGLVTLNVAIE
ncbi:hypothetical protein [Chitinophaga japonensis]|uniref:Secreted protein n=1 Tax=Chitinophaga japonensis TaxID=104662 RepID=A0A562TDP2_CHIJA|nr:hypothetical protein [Chitinophaga japonensis]TWI91632.1 hypothetical protein LX66_1007 [Chitinophaga japonensis]